MENVFFPFLKNLLLFTIKFVHFPPFEESLFY